MTEKIEDQIDYYSRQLRLPAFRSHFAQKAKLAAKNNTSLERYLLDLMITEYEQRQIRRKKQRIRRAAFPYQKTTGGIWSKMNSLKMLKTN